MKGMVYRGPGAIEYGDMPDPGIEDDRDIIVAVKLCSICGSDLHIYAGDVFSADVGYCVGHEAVGEVVAVGKAVTTRKVGELVMLPAAVGCGECRSCQAGNILRCERDLQTTYGLSNALQGSQAEAVRVPVGDFNAWPIPDGLELDQALMLTDAAPTAWYGCDLARVEAGNATAVIGVGPIGLMAVEQAFLRGASVVYAIDPVPERRAWAERLGAIALSPDEARDTIREQTRGRMLDSVIEASGAVEALGLGVRLAGREKFVGVIGVNLSPTITFPWRNAFMNGVTIAPGTASVPRYYPALVPLLQAGRLKPEKFITSRCALADGPDAYRGLVERRDGSLKVALRP